MDSATNNKNQLEQSRRQRQSRLLARREHQDGAERCFGFASRANVAR
jgi:hypothetical protein